MNIPVREAPEAESGIESALEAVLFAAGEPVSLKRLAAALQAAPDDIRAAAENLAGQYRYERRGIRLMVLDEHLQLCSAPEYAAVIRRTLEERKPPPMSRASLEVLALAAYYQPVTRAYIDKVRGVESGATVAKLCEKGLLKESGRMEVPGRPVLYRTTAGFLRTFGLASLDELPDPDAADQDGNIQLTLNDLPIEADAADDTAQPEESALAADRNPVDEDSQAGEDDCRSGGREEGKP